MSDTENVNNFDAPTVQTNDNTSVSEPETEETESQRAEKALKSYTESIDLPLEIFGAFNVDMLPFLSAGNTNIYSRLSHECYNLLLERYAPGVITKEPNGRVSIQSPPLYETSIDAKTWKMMCLYSVYTDISARLFHFPQSSYISGIVFCGVRTRFFQAQHTADLPKTLFEHLIDMDTLDAWNDVIKIDTNVRYFPENNKFVVVLTNMYMKTELNRIVFIGSGITKEINKFMSDVSTWVSLIIETISVYSIRFQSKAVYNKLKLPKVVDIRLLQNTMYSVGTKTFGVVQVLWDQSVKSHTSSIIVEIEKANDTFTVMFPLLKGENVRTNATELPTQATTFTSNNDQIQSTFYIRPELGVYDTRFSLQNFTDYYNQNTISQVVNGIPDQLAVKNVVFDSVDIYSKLFSDNQKHHFGVFTDYSKYDVLPTSYPIVFNPLSSTFLIDFISSVRSAVHNTFNQERMFDGWKSNELYVTVSEVQDLVIDGMVVLHFGMNYSRSNIKREIYFFADLVIFHNQTPYHTYDWLYKLQTELQNQMSLTETPTQMQIVMKRTQEIDLMRVKYPKDMRTKESMHTLFKANATFLEQKYIKPFSGTENDMKERNAKMVSNMYEKQIQLHSSIVRAYAPGSIDAGANVAIPKWFGNADTVSVINTVSSGPITDASVVLKCQQFWTSASHLQFTKSDINRIGANAHLQEYKNQLRFTSQNVVQELQSYTKILNAQFMIKQKAQDKEREKEAEKDKKNELTKLKDTEKERKELEKQQARASQSSSNVTSTSLRNTGTRANDVSESRRPSRYGRV